MSLVSAREPVIVAVVDDHELVVRGVEAMLAPHADRVAVVDFDPDSSRNPPVDIVLVDPLGWEDPEDPRLQDCMANPLVGQVILFVWDLTDQVIALATAEGLRSALSKSLDAESLITALTLAQNDSARTALPSPEEVPVPTTTWVGHTDGLTPRELEIIALITSGMSNNDIAECTYLSVNSVKSYIRSAYRTMGVTSRSRAVLWGIDHGLAPTRTCVAPPRSATG